MSVPGNDSVRLDLGQVLPRRGELALHVVVSRGRLAASVLDVIPELGRRPATAGLAAHPAANPPSAVLLGLPRGRATDVLAVANPGERRGAGLVEVLTADSAFAPEGVEELRVRPVACGQ